MNMKTRFCKHEYEVLPLEKYSYSDKVALARLNKNLVLVRCKKCGTKKWVYKK